MNAAAAYATFRGSPAFLFTLVAVLLACGIAHDTIGFDPDWGLTNLALSMEASISVAMLMMDSAKQDAAQRRQDELQRQQLRYMLEIMEGVHAQLVATPLAIGVANRAPAISDLAAPEKAQDSARLAEKTRD